MAKKDKIKTREEISEISDKLKKEDKIVITTNGSFDVLHVGHIRLLSEAKCQGDELIVGLNTDDSVRRWKELMGYPDWNGRPIYNQEDRSEMLAALECVDYVTLFDETDCIKFIESVKPNIHVNGSEYGENCIERETVEKYGKLYIIRLFEDYSTSKLIKKIKNLEEETLAEIDKIIKVPKVWGYEIWMANTELYCGKQLVVKKGKRSSLHTHEKKDETFYIQNGKILIEIENKIEEVITKGDSVRIKPFTKHRFSGLEDSTIIEISTHHEDSDSYRVKGQLSGDVPKEIMEKYS